MTVQKSQGGMYGMLWRWHFFAALLVIPFILWQSVTGVTFLWHRELASAAHPEYLYVEPAEQKISFQSQLEVAQARHPGQNLSQIQIEAAPDRSTVFMFDAANGLSYPAFVNPYNGVYLGAVEPVLWLPGISRALHGGWPLGNLGSYILELGACWTIVMILSGLYLWWPRNTTRFAGIFYPRLGNGVRIFWRDVHSVVGVYFSVIVLAFLVTAMPWTSFWGANVLGPVQAALGQSSPADRFFSHGPMHSDTTSTATAEEHAHSGHTVQQLDLDAIMAVAREQGLSGGMDIRWLETTALMRSHADRSPDRLFLTVDRNTGNIAERAGWEAFPLLPKLVSLGVDLHEGHYFGRLNQLFNTLVASSLVWLTYSGFMGWYRRRPGNGVSPPPRREVAFPISLVVTIGILAVILPMLGMSIVLLLLCDRLFRNVLTPAQG